MAGGHGVELDWISAEELTTAWLFGEDQGRYLIETSATLAVQASAAAAGVPIQRIGTVRRPELTLSRKVVTEGQTRGTVQGHGSVAELTLSGVGAISVAELRAANEAWLPGYMAQG
jgi:phosphoribosylformylglycinamidine synthase